MDGQLPKETRVINNDRDSDTGEDRDPQTRRSLGILVMSSLLQGHFVYASAQAVFSRALTGFASRLSFLKKRRDRALK